MQPTFNINELILVRKNNKSTQYLVGDIITYYDKEIDIDVTHRIVQIDGEKIYTKGDYNNSRDLNPVTEEQIVGKVIYNSYFLGYLYVNYRFIIITLIIIAIIAFNILLEDTRREKLIQSV